MKCHKCGKEWEHDAIEAFAAGWREVLIPNWRVMHCPKCFVKRRIDGRTQMARPNGKSRSSIY